MQKIGLIGGITPESTILYYRILNELNSKKNGLPHSAEVVINSFDFGQISQLQKENRWDLLNDMMARSALDIERAGATCIIICANTMHLCIDAVRKIANIPVIHIAEATAKSILEKKLTKVALLGTKYTMEKDFFIDILTSFGIEAIIPDQEDRNEIHRVIYSELSAGKIIESSKESYISIINKLIKKGAEGVILGCTEIPLLINQKDVSIPVFDTTSIHANAAYNYAIKIE